MCHACLPPSGVVAAESHPCWTECMISFKADIKINRAGGAPLTKHDHDSRNDRGQNTQSASFRARTRNRFNGIPLPPGRF